MSTPSRPRLRRPGRRPAERGFILVVGLLFMLVLMLLSASMFRSFTSQEKIAGNTMDKQRSFEVAQGALQSAENWLNAGSAGAATACSGPLTTLTVCSNPITWALNDTWSSGYTYTRTGLTVNAAGGLVSAGGDVNYNAAPGVYVYYVGLTADGQGSLYQVTANAAGANGDTHTVVQSTFRMQSGTSNLGGP
jgi:type IV pilus assembly protein PilX